VQICGWEFDVSELSLSSYLLTLDQPEPPFVALPYWDCGLERSPPPPTLSGCEKLFRCLPRCVAAQQPPGFRRVPNLASARVVVR
jgi:hypothetical protein